MDENEKRLENSRKKLRIYDLIFWVLFISSVIVYVIGKPSDLKSKSFIWFTPLSLIGIGLFVIGFLYFIFILKKVKKSYYNDFKVIIVEKILGTLFTDISCDFSRGINEDIIRNTRMMRMGNRYRSDMYISANYKDVHFEQANVLIEQRNYSSDHSNTVILFRGRWMIFDFNKNFNCDLQIRQKGFSNAKKSTNIFTVENKMKKMSFEDQEFNGRFNVYSTSEHEAYYILTPNIIESIKKIDDFTDGKLLLCFSGNKLHVAATKNSMKFHPPIWRKIDKDKVKTTILDDLKIITRFIDDLKLNKKIYK